MEFFNVLKTRQSIRRFKRNPIEEEKLTKILEAANSAPSAGNLQAYKIFVVRNQSKKEALAEAALGQTFIAKAPVILVFCADAERSAKRYGQRGADLYSLQDATIAASYAQLAVVDLGLGSVWVGAFNEDEVREIVNLSQNYLPVCILPIGYPDERPTRKTRRNLDDLVSYL